MLLSSLSISIANIHKCFRKLTLNFFLLFLFDILLQFASSKRVTNRLSNSNNDLSNLNSNSLKDIYLENNNYSKIKSFLELNMNMHYSELSAKDNYIIIGTVSGVVVVALTIVIYCCCCKKSEEDLQKEAELVKEKSKEQRRERIRKSVQENAAKIQNVNGSLSPLDLYKNGTKTEKHGKY